MCCFARFVILLLMGHGPAPFFFAHAFIGSTISKSTAARRVNALTAFNGKSILLVDDEEGIRKAVGTLLQQNGYMVELCEDATIALQTIQAKPNAFDCIISDVRMPGPSGLDFAQTLQTQGFSSLPIILLTAAGHPNDRIAGYQAGADAYLPKPFDPDELLAIIERLVDRNVSMTDIRSELSAIKESLQYQQQDVFLAADERQVLEYVSQGWTTKEIAAELFLSTRRIDQLMTILFRKANVKNRTELVRWAIAQGKVKL